MSFANKKLMLKLVAASVIYRRSKKTIPIGIWMNTLKKGLKGLSQTKIAEFYHITKAQMDAKITLVSDSLTLNNNLMDPILIIAVKDDLVRIKLVYEHYRAIGVHQFCMIDNGSTDGTLEFLTSQSDTRVYKVTTPYLSVRKEGWVQYVLDQLGYNRWYIVVDSDELLDYPGSEIHSVQELIRKQTAMGNERLNGYMLDMYTNRPIYSVACSSHDIPKEYCYFDTESYVMGSVLYNRPLPMGGARERATGVSCWSGKCPLFCYRKETVNISAHFQYPFVDINETNFCVVLRHYKFLISDLCTYQQRADLSSGYGDTTKEYAAANQFAQNSSNTFMYQQSVCYKSSQSLMKLPMLYDTFNQKINPRSL